MSHLRLALPLAICGALAPFALDTYLPAFPLIASDYGVTVHELSLSIAIYIFALAIGQLIGGPLADHFGRPTVMRAGLTVFTMVSLAIAQTHELTSLLALRALQAIGGGCIIVCVPALVREHYQGREAAKLFSLIGLIAVAAPAVAPSIGALLLNWQWPAIFIFLASYALIAWVVLELTLFKQHRKHRHHQQFVINKTTQSSAIARYLHVLSVKPALRFVFLQGFIFSVMMVFVTHASFIYQTHFNVSEQAFALLFGANILVMWCTMLVNRKLLQCLQPKQILRIAVTVQSLAVALLVIIVQLNLSVFYYAPALMLTVGMIGATSPNCQACFMDYFHINGATAAAVMGAMQFGLSGVLSSLSSFLPESLQAITLLQLVCALIAVYLIHQRKHHSTIDNSPCTIS